MKCAIILLACIAAAHCHYYVPQPPPQEVCDRVCKPYGNNAYTQVCSKTNKTFKNECFLNCAWEDKECEGACPCLIKVQREAYCICEKQKTYVCGVDRNTYDNKCIADCKNIKVMHEGKCLEW